MKNTDFQIGIQKRNAEIISKWRDRTKDKDVSRTKVVTELAAEYGVTTVTIYEILKKGVSRRKRLFRR